MQAIQIDNDVFICALHKEFPPTGARSDLSPDDLRRYHQISDAGYNKIQVWQRICGLYKMDMNKCRSCTHCRKLIEQDYLLVMVSLDGKQKTPYIDAETLKVFHRSTPPVRLK